MKNNKALGKRKVKTDSPKSGTCRKISHNLLLEFNSKKDNFLPNPFFNNYVVVCRRENCRYSKYAFNFLSSVWSILILSNYLLQLKESYM